MKRLIPIALLLVGCQTAPRTHHTPALAPISLAPVKAAIATAQGQNTRLEAKSIVVEKWLMERLGK